MELITRISLEDCKQFAAYVKSFYGPGELYGTQFNPPLTEAEIGIAIGIYIVFAESFGGWGDGDSADRENVRDILLQMRRIG